MGIDVECQKDEGEREGGEDGLGTKIEKFKELRKPHASLRNSKNPSFPIHLLAERMKEKSLWGTLKHSTFQGKKNYSERKKIRNAANLPILEARKRLQYFRNVE